MAHVRHVRRCAATAVVGKVKFAMERRSAVRSRVGMGQHRAEACAVNRVGFVIRFTAAGLFAVRNRRDVMTPFIRFLNAAIPVQFVKTAVAKKIAKAVCAVTKFAVLSAMSAKTTHARLPVIRQPIRVAVPTKNIAVKMAKKPVCSMRAWNAKAIVCCLMTSPAALTNIAIRRSCHALMRHIPMSVFIYRLKQRLHRQ